MATKDYIDFRGTIIDDDQDEVQYLPREWSDEYYGCPDYREYAEEWS